MNKVITGIATLVALTIIAGLVLAIITQLTWNHCLIGAVDGVHPITFLQAWGLNILCGMLFRTSASKSE